ncbi:hypothetical protein [Sporomusa malonica]|uniref:Uncharacterized protein n=1 Tax=Sporomusa malonica TaxID=112901 RepID=A0A1W2EUL9_9FIRM|nr:hypothetical protein [Sporomusa malonica]SMD13407.1 hypothetical protein SAMN04488500_1314 [Sporomusa malonica]
MDNLNDHDLSVSNNCKADRKIRRCRRCRYKHKCKKYRKKVELYQLTDNCFSGYEEVYQSDHYCHTEKSKCPDVPCYQLQQDKKSKPSRITTQLQGLQLQLQNPIGNTIAPGETVLFDSIITAQSLSISYNNSGIITITESGLFYIHWWVVTDGMEGGTALAPIFSIITSAADNDRASSTAITGQVNGNALIPIFASPELPVTLQLINGTDSTIAFSETPIKADITIISVTCKG